MTANALIETLARALCLSDRRSPCVGCAQVTEDHNGTCDAPADFLESEGYLDQATAVLAALHAAGMVVVPVEPTEAMIHAAVTAPYGRTLGERVINEYRAMLLAGGEKP